MKARNVPALGECMQKYVTDSEDSQSTSEILQFELRCACFKAGQSKVGLVPPASLNCS